MKVNLNPLTWEDGNDNMGGFKAFVLFIPQSAVSSVPKLPSVVTTDVDAVTAAGAFVFKTVGDKPKYIQCTDKTVKFSAENQGEIEGQSFTQTGEFFRAGSKKEYAALARQVNNVPGYLILEDMDGNQIMVGQPNLPCHVKPAFDGGQARTDRRGYKFTFASDAVAPVIYLGTPINVDNLLGNPILIP